MILGPGTLIISVNYHGRGPPRASLVTHHQNCWVTRIHIKMEGANHLYKLVLWLMCVHCDILYASSHTVINIENYLPSQPAGSGTACLAYLRPYVHTYRDMGRREREQERIRSCGGGSCLKSQHLGGWGRRISVSSRPVRAV